MKKTILVLVAGTMAWGGSLTFLSSASQLGASNQFGSNVNLVANPYWSTDPGGANWISFENTGYGAGSIFLANNSSSPTAKFYQTFTLTNPDALSFILNMTVWADDTASIFLDGVQLIGPDFTTSPHCSDPAVGIGCQGLGTLLTTTASNSPNQLHTLEFDVYQLGGDVFGLMYDGGVTFADSVATPEPASFALFGAGLIGLGMLRRKSRP